MKKLLLSIKLDLLSLEEQLTWWYCLGEKSQSEKWINQHHHYITLQENEGRYLICIIKKMLQQWKSFSSVFHATKIVEHKCVSVLNHKWRQTCIKWISFVGWKLSIHKLQSFFDKNFSVVSHENNKYLRFLANKKYFQTIQLTSLCHLCRCFCKVINLNCVRYYENHFG